MHRSRTRSTSTPRCSWTAPTLPMSTRSTTSCGPTSRRTRTSPSACSWSACAGRAPPQRLERNALHPIHNGRTDMPDSSAQQLARSDGFHRSIGLFSGTAINMTQMCGIGPFITIPIMVATMGGPQAMIGWIAGALLAVADGLVWAELGAAMPGSGGTYVYLREAFQYRTGKLMPFLFIWTVL